MKRCPLCKSTFSDEANFCPMDAGHLEPVAPVAPEPVPAAAVAPVPVPLDQATVKEQVLGGRFRVGSKLGGRRTGEVFAAEDGVSGQPCVVKLIAPAVLPTALVAQRTERELKQLQKVTSERVARVLDCGKQGSQVWLAMELVAGVPLGELVQANGPLPVDQALRLGIEVGEALSDAAKVGVIHRDVSPKNVLVLDDMHAKVLNFGVPTPGQDKISGQPEFLAPEQAEGKPVDQRSNIYSLGAVLYFMVTGEPPFVGDAQAVLQQLGHGSPPPPSVRAPNAAIPTDVERTIMKALEKQTSRRHLTLRQLLGELEGLAKTAQSASAQEAARSASARAKTQLAPAPPVQPQAPKSAEPAPQPAPATAAAPTAKKAPDGQSAAWPEMPPAESATLKGSPAPRPSLAPSNAAQTAAAPAPTASPAAPAAEKAPAATGAAAEPSTEDGTAATAATAPAPAIVSKPKAATGAMAAAGRPKSLSIPGKPTGPTTLAPPAAQGGSRPAVAGGKKGRALTATPPGKKGKFRETMWFKKGLLDEAAATEAAKTKPKSDGEVILDKADEIPMEDRYKDDGTLTRSDQEKLSLRTGSTQMMPAVKEAAVVPGERMGEDEIVSELKAGRGKAIAMILAGIVVVGALVTWLVLSSRSTSAPKAGTPAASGAAPSAPSPAAGGPAPAAPAGGPAGQ